jgi:hypothetical protein
MDSYYYYLIICSSEPVVSAENQLNKVITFIHQIFVMLKTSTKHQADAQGHRNEQNICIHCTQRPCCLVVYKTSNQPL